MNIKRTIFAAFLATLFFTSAFGQRNPSLISSRHYIGAEIGVNYSWLAGGDQFFWPYDYPYSDDPTNPVVMPLQFANLGGGIGLHIAATLDIALSDFISLQGKVFYRQHSMSQTEQFTDSCFDENNNFGMATNETNYDLTLSYLGGSIGARLQFVPESFYGLLGIDFSSLSSNSFSGYQKIISSTNGCAWVMLPSRTFTGQTDVILPKQTVNDFFNTSQLHLKVGVGTFIQLDQNDWVLTPELAVGIPLSNLFTTDFETNYENIGVTTPKLWYAALSVGIKFPFGAKSRDEMNRSVESDEEDRGASEKDDEEGYANLTGRVTDARTGDPLKADITVTDLKNQKVVGKTSTGSDGLYEVRVKAPGKYSVTADAGGYLFGTTYFEVDANGRILKGDHDLKLSSASDGRTRLLIFFEFNKDDLQPESYPELERAVGIMKAYPDMQVEIAGYTDNVGSDSYNKDLSKRRANAVKDYLVKHGIESGRVQAKGYGKEAPIMTNETDEGRAANRRVEFVVLRK